MDQILCVYVALVICGFGVLLTYGTGLLRVLLGFRVSVYNEGFQLKVELISETRIGQTGPAG